jgi:hypothetical protein
MSREIVAGSKREFRFRTWKRIDVSAKKMGATDGTDCENE